MNDFIFNFSACMWSPSFVLWFFCVCVCAFDFAFDFYKTRNYRNKQAIKIVRGV